MAELAEDAEELGKKLRCELQWHMPEMKNQWRLYCREVADFREWDQCPEHFAWLKEKLELFDATFRPMIPGLSSPEE